MDVPIRYQVDLSGVKTHQLKIQMSVEPPQDGPVDIALPFMSPGSPVNSRNHTARLSHLEITDQNGAALPYEKLREGGWRVDRAQGPLQLSYTLLADDFAASKNQLNDEHAYLNGPAAFMYLKGHDTDLAATITLHNVPDPSWSAISTLPRVRGTPNTFYAISFQELADSNVEVGHLDVAEGNVADTHLTVVKHGSSPYPRLHGAEVSAQQNLDDFKRIFRAFGAEYGTFPSQRYKAAPALPAEVEGGDHYTIIKHYLNANVGLSAGFEHYHGHELTFSKANEDGVHRSYDDAPRELENKVMAHELGHKLLGKFVQHDGIDSCDFAREHPSDGLWLTEGVTEWLGTIMERRANLITPEQYLSRLSAQMHRYQLDYQIDPTNARDDSLDAQHGNSEYYTKGAVLGAVLDLEILKQSKGEKSFKDVLVGLKDEFGGSGDFHRLDDIKRIARRVVAQYPGASDRLETVFHDYLEDRKPIDFNAFLAHAGLQLTGKTDHWPSERLALANGALTTDAQGRPSVSDAAPCIPTEADAFRTLIPAAGIALAWDDGGHLQLSTVSPTGSGFAAGLGSFEGARLDALSLHVGGENVPVPVTRDAKLQATTARGSADAMSLTFTRTRQFDGAKEQVTIDVPLRATPRWEIEERADADDASRSLRSKWLAQVPESLLTRA